MSALYNPVASTTRSVVDLCSALLDVDGRLGCAEEDLRRARNDVTVRRFVARRLLQPKLRYLQVRVNYDHPSHYRFDPEEYSNIHPALTVRSFTISRSGIYDIWMAEIFPGHVLSTQQQLKLISLLRLRTPCLAETRDTLNTKLRRPRYPIMSHCGQRFSLESGEEAMPSILQTETGRTPTAARLYARWSQDYRVLAVDDDRPI